jgi:predicted dehydrogenase
MFNVGIIGCGVVSKDHIEAYRATPGVQLKAVCDMNVQQAEKLARRYKIPRFYGDFASMLRNEDLNLVSVCTPYNIRSQVVIPAVEKRINVLTEKPFAMTATEADEMLEAARENGVSLCVVHNILFQPAARRLLSLIRKGKIGSFIGAEVGFVSDGSDWISQNKNHWCHSLPGGRFGEGMPHVVYLALALASPLRIEDVFIAQLGNRPWLNPDELRVILRSPEGGLVSLYNTLNANRYDIYIDVYGTEGQVHVNLVNNTLTFLGKRDWLSRSAILWDNISASFNTLMSFPLHLAMNVKDGHPHKLIIQSLIKSIREKTPPPVSPEMARQTVALCESICARIESMKKTAVPIRNRLRSE